MPDDTGQVIFEALNALYGDCILIHYPQRDGAGGQRRLTWMIDGGPPEAYGLTLRARLEQMAQPGGPTRLRLAVVTHIDADHIAGLGRLVGALRAAPRPPGTPDIAFADFWFNGFSQTFGAPAPAALAAGDVALAATDPALHGLSEAFVQSVGDGVRLLEDLANLTPPPNINHAFANRVAGASDAQNMIPMGSDPPVTIEMLGPSQKQLDALRKAWARDRGLDPAQLAAARVPKVDTSTANRSSIVFLARFGDVKFLLTGDARARDIVKVWTARHGAAPFPIDVMKVPHHGAEGNNSLAMFQLFPADHYVFCADGSSSGNPDIWTLERLIEARRDASFHIHLTCPDTAPDMGSQAAFLARAAQDSGGRITLHWRDPQSDGIRITLP